MTGIAEDQTLCISFYTEGFSIDLFLALYISNILHLFLEAIPTEVQQQ